MAVGIALALAGFSAYAFSARLEVRGDGKQRTILVADSTTDSLEDEGGPLLSATYAKCRAPSEKDGCESMPFGVVDTHLEPSALFGGAGCYETRARVRAVWD